jgi:hypothetical protein
MGSATRCPSQKLGLCAAAKLNIPCYAKVVNDVLWKMVIEEIKEGDQDLMILQGEVLTKWREYAMMGCPYRQMINSSECLVLTIE